MISSNIEKPSYFHSKMRERHESIKNSEDIEKQEAKCAIAAGKHAKGRKFWYPLIPLIPTNAWSVSNVCFMK